MSHSSVAGLSTDRDDVRVERCLEEAIAEHAEAAVDESAAGDETARKIAPVAPDLPARSRASIAQPVSSGPVT